MGLLFLLPVSLLSFGGLLIALEIPHAAVSKEHEALNHISTLTNDFLHGERIPVLEVHFDKKSSHSLIRKLLKDSTAISYVGLDGYRTSTFVNRQHNREAHLFVEKDFNRLNKLLSSQENKNSNARNNKEIPSSNIWLVHIEQVLIRDHVDQLSNIFMKTPLRLDSLVFAFFESDKASNTYSIFEIYKIDELSEDVEVVEYGKWAPNHGVIIFEKDIWKRRSDFKGRHLRIVSSVTNPYTSVVKDGCISMKCFKGLYAEVFHGLQQILNFTYTVSLVEAYGSRSRNNSWTGMIGNLLEGTADFAAASFSQSKARSEVVDFISLHMEEYQQIFIRNPAELYDWEVYTMPLTKQAWFGVLGFSLVVPILLLPLMIDLKEGNSNYQLLSDCFNIVYRSLLLLGCNMAPETTRKRIVFLTALTMGMVLYWLWEAMLISYFSAAKLTLPFNNLEELLLQSDSKLVLAKGYISEDFFRYSSDRVLQDVWSKRIEPYIDYDSYPTSEAELQDFVVDHPSFALFGDSLSQKSYDGYKHCKFIEIPRKYGNYPSGFTLPKNSSIEPVFRYYVKRLLESGSVDQIKTVYEKSSGNQVCPNYDGKPIGLNKSFSLFAMYFTAIFLSLIILILEVFFYYTKLHRGIKKSFLQTINYFQKKNI